MLAGPLARQLAVAALVLVGVNVGVARAARNTLPRQAHARLQRATSVTDLFVGNSLMAAGLDERAWQSAAPGTVPLNASLGFTFSVEHYLLSLSYAGRPPRRFFYGYYGDQLSEEPHARFSELRANRTLVFFADRDTAARYLYPDNPLWRAEFRVLARLPLFTERGAIWERVEVLRRRLGEYGRGQEETNRFGRARDFGFLDERAEWFVGTLRAAPAGECSLAPALAAMLRRQRAIGSEVIVIRMPSPRRFRERYHGAPEWRAYEQCIRARLTEAGMTRHVDAADWIEDELFMDPAHLGPAGATAFTRRLAATVLTPAAAPDQP